MRLYLVRHGATAINERDKVYQGWMDTELTSLGRQQCETVREKLWDVKFNAVISSPLQRAVTSAQIITGLGREALLLEDDLKELHFGLWDGLSYPEIVRRYPEESRAWEADWQGFCLPQGESYGQFAQRVQRSLVRLLERHQEQQNVLAVCHSGTIKVMVIALLQLAPEFFWQLKVESGCYSLFEIGEGRTNIWKLNG